MTTRTVSARVDFTAETDHLAVFSLAAARSGGTVPEGEVLRLLVDGREAPLEETVDLHGTRVHLARVPGGTECSVSYALEVEGRPGAAPPAEAVDRVRYTRPSRYCPFDEMAGAAEALFPGARGGAGGYGTLQQVRDWVHEHLDYVPGSSTGTDTAVHTYLARQGVCRDYAHLVITLLRALAVPARLVSVYAPGLDPMDFHAVVEAWHEGAWYVLDATGLAPRSEFVRIATGADASGTAFMTTLGGRITLGEMRVRAESSAQAVEDPRARIVLPL
ncbi:cysteine protease [Kocuria dechangensis]|uniref:Cysteine protease n=1 Tax=Kocuria dechangensis TaxID=1176249 RepID=A0A917GUS4_9MICC|nr:transglutaminase domain-containing protein [Kocuria dechangensis]GGG57252.1 cysteine protease [Kocuria dechangensis]